MKCLQTIVLILLCSHLFGQQIDGYITISGKIADLGNEKIYVRNKNSITLPGQIYPYLDSIIAKNDQFEMKVPLKECLMISLEKEGSEKWITFLGIPNTHYTVQGDTATIYQASIKGDQEYEDYTKLVQVLSKLESKNPVDSNAITMIANHIQKYNSSTSALFAMNYISRIYPTDVNLSLMKQLNPKVQETELYQTMMNTIDQVPFNNWNKDIPKDGFLTTENEPFNWNKLKDKYTVISFWASYCGPCLAEIPELEALIKKYNVNFVSISLDNDRFYWLNTINRSKYPGIHINNFKGFNSPLLNYFKIKSIPKLYLLDKDLKPLESEGSLISLLQLLDKTKL